MIIQVDEEGMNVVKQLVDLALKEGGISNLNQVNVILKSVVVLPTPDVEENSQPKSLEKEDEAAGILSSS